MFGLALGLDHWQEKQANFLSLLAYSTLREKWTPQHTSSYHPEQIRLTKW